MCEILNTLAHNSGSGDERELRLCHPSLTTSVRVLVDTSTVQTE